MTLILRTLETHLSLVYHLSHYDPHRGDTFNTPALLIPKALFQRLIPPCTSESCYKPCFSASSSRTSIVVWLPHFFPFGLVYFSLSLLALLINHREASLFKDSALTQSPKGGYPTPDSDFRRDRDFKSQFAWEG